MTREIKFRAWLIKDEVIVDVDIVSWVKEDKFIGHSPVSRFIETIGGHARYEYEGASKLEDSVLLQFTGYRNVNGEEVYEHYIVEDVKSGRKAKIVWDPIGCAWGYEGEMGGHLSVHDRLKIIGNIYENPELLEA